MNDPYEEQRASSGTLATIVFLVTTAVLFIIGPGIGALFSFRGIAFVVIGMFAAAIVVGVPMYLLQRGVAKILVGTLMKRRSPHAMSVTKSSGLVLMLVHVAVTVLVTNLAFDYFVGSESLSAVPERFEDDRAALTETFTAFGEVSDLTQVPAGSSSSRPASPDHTSQVEAALERGMDSGEEVDTTFLDWLHPEMQHHFETQYLRGNRLYLEGLREGNVSKQAQGVELIQTWYREFWSENAEPVLDRAYGE